MKYLFTLIIGLLLLTSCNEYFRARSITQQGSRLLGGPQTNYTGNYTFLKDSLVSQNVFNAVEAFMDSKGWHVSSEGAQNINFSFRSTPAAQQTTNKQQRGNANFRVNNLDSVMTLQLSLNGNYNFGTRDNANELYTELKDYLYGR